MSMQNTLLQTSLYDMLDGGSKCYQDVEAEEWCMRTGPFSAA